MIYYDTKQSWRSFPWPKWKLCGGISWRRLYQYCLLGSSPQFIWNFVVALYRQEDMSTKLVTSSTYPIFIFFFFLRLKHVCGLRWADLHVFVEYLLFLTRARVAAAIALMHCHICVEAAGVRNKFVTDNNNTQAGARGGQHFFLGSIR